MVAIYCTIYDRLIALGEDTHKEVNGQKYVLWLEFLSHLIFFSAHFMLEILGHTNELFECL